MRKIFWVIIIICVLCVALFATYTFLYKKSVTPNTITSDNLVLTNEQKKENDEYNAKLLEIQKIVEKEFADTIKTKLENWALYKKVSDPSYGTRLSPGSDCKKANDEYIDYAKKVETGPIHTLQLPYGLSIFYTLNYENWTADKFLSFTDEDMGTCGISTVGRLAVIANRVLWTESRCVSASCGHGQYAGTEDQNYYLAQSIQNYFSQKTK